MILSLENSNHKIATEMHTVFQASYAIEAKLLRVIDFPPLKRTITDFLNSTSEFYGYWENEEIAGVIEVKNEEDSTDIQSLVVHPKYFRRGIATQLIRFILKQYDSRFFEVETGLDNTPAIQLYEGFGFKEIKQWDIDHGIRKIGFKMDRKPDVL